MATKTEPELGQPLATLDEFVTAVPWGESRTALVHRRMHGWREYVRFRTWNRHKQTDQWYPSRRHFVIPIENADDLVGALLSALSGEADEKPIWLLDYEHAEDAQLRALGASPDMTAEEVEKMKRRAAQIRRQQH